MELNLGRFIGLKFCNLKFGQGWIKFLEKDIATKFVKIDKKGFF